MTMTTDRIIAIASILARLQSFARIWGNDSTKRLVDEAIREAKGTP